MERQSKFDKAVRNKMLPMGAEPSAKVWANLRAEIGSGNPQPAILYYKVALAAAVALLVGMTLVFTFGKGEDISTRIAKMKWEPVSDPLQKARKSLITAGSRDTPRDTLRKKPVMLNLQTHPGPSEGIAKIDPDTSFQKEIVPQPEQKEIIANENPPQEQLKEELKARLEVPKKDSSVANNQPKSNPSRDLPLPKPKEQVSKGSEAQNNSLIASLTEGADKYLGIDANYEEEVYADVRKTEFKGNFGLFKIKRVRKTKN